MTEQPTSKRKRRMAREPKTGTSSSPAPATTTPKTPSKLNQVAALLLADGGASIVEMMAATGWQQHSVRGALAGALRKRGLAITSDKVEGVRRYRAARRA